MKVPKVKLYEHPEVFKKLNTEERLILLCIIGIFNKASNKK